RALRGVRAGRAGRCRGGRPQLQPPRGGGRRGRGQRRPVRAAAARHAGGCEGAGRQLRRDQEREPRRRGQGQPPDLSRRRQRRLGATANTPRPGSVSSEESLMRRLMILLGTLAALVAGPALADTLAEVKAGNAAFAEGRYEAAVEAFSKAILAGDLDPDSL